MVPADTALAAQGWRAFSIAVPWSTNRLCEIGGIIELDKIVMGPVDKALVLEVFCIQQQTDRVIIDGVIASARNMAMRFVLRGGVREEICTLGQHHRRFIVVGGHFVRHGGVMLWESALVVCQSCAPVSRLVVVPLICFQTLDEGILGWSRQASESLQR